MLRLEQTSVLSVMEKPFLLTERAKGLSASYIEIYHVLPNSLMPVITMLGTFFASILGGSVIIEQVFQWPGVGKEFIDAVRGQNYPLVMMIALLLVSAVLIVSFLIDVVTALLDPRVKLK